MALATMELTNFHLEQSQKQALRERAKANGTHVAEEIRNAVSAYLSGVAPEDQALLNAATQQTESLVNEMNELLCAVNTKADLIFAELEKLRSTSTSGIELTVGFAAGSAAA
jgi:predicted transcriptional regulator